MSDFTQIQTFIEVAESGSFAAAGRKLSLPRSTISARIQGLENRLNTRLFNRNTRNTSLTNEGIAYLADCRKALNLITQAENRFGNQTILSGQLKISVPVAFPKKALAKLLSAFSQRHPELSIEILVSDATHDLISENIDLAIRGRAVGDLDLIARPLGKVELSYFASAEFLKAHSHLTTKQLIEEHCLFAPMKKRKPQCKVKTESFDLAKQLVLEGLGIAVLANAFCQSEVESGQLQKLKHTPKLTPLPMYLVYPNRVHMAPRVRALIDFILENHKSYDIG